MAKLIKTNGVEEQIILENANLSQIQTMIGGYFEQINVDGGLLMINEEGIKKNLPLNYKASALAQQPIRGNAIFAIHDEAES